MKGFDPVAAWQRLHPKQKEQLGIAAVALGVAICGAGESDATKLFDAACVECELLINAIAESQILGGQVPDGVDLSGLGIRQCRTCGCTDGHACDGGCYWVEDDLCSACAPAKVAHGH